MSKSYSELLKIDSFEKRLEYLRTNSKVADETFGSKRYLNQKFYNTREWKHVRDEVICRDMGCDLGLEDHPINGKIYVHHMNPITIDDIKNKNPKVLDRDNLVCVSKNTHDSIHYGCDIFSDFKVRTPNDTCPWRK